MKYHIYTFSAIHYAHYELSSCTGKQYLRIELHFFVCFGKWKNTGHVARVNLVKREALLKDLHATMQCPSISQWKQTRAPRGTDRSPEYNEDFCYKLDSTVTNLTTEWNQKQQHFITHASRSLLWIRFVARAFRSEEDVFWRRGTPPPPVTYFASPWICPGQIWPKHLYACAGLWALHPY